ncbi:hypothetical protein [Microbacterium sp. ZXX196]|uniref:hypothetical protein n=1 Tax=Microbacterium sp. ZXX196 TaxID=2609291 RepID=UPI0012B76BBC|nr:hypothetical protein [Microbacterium sp. ZXX196]MTE24816.1 hypothetical protein [Microbacterium sp. ZXX196]
MALVDYFPEQFALDPNTMRTIPNAEADVYAVTDTGRTTPLQIVEHPSGVTMSKLTANASGLYPAFRTVSGIEQVIAVSGTLETPLNSLYAAVIAAGMDPRGVPDGYAPRVVDGAYEMVPTPDQEQVVQAITDSGTALTNSGTALTQAGEAKQAAQDAQQAAEDAAQVTDAGMTSVAADPESAFSNQLNATIEETVAPMLPTAGMVIIEHGDVASTPRLSSEGDTFTGPALWLGEVIPLNRIAGDFYFEVSTVPVPILVWSDSAGTDGPLGTTEVGGFEWAVVGTGYTAAKSGGQFVFTGATSSVGVMRVDDGETDVTFSATIAVKGANNQAGIVVRYVDLNNHLVIHRTSSVDATYRISERVATAYTTLATLTGHTMTDGDKFRITTKADGTLVVVLNDVEVYSGTIARYATATIRGLFCGAYTNYAEMAYDDLSVMTAV